MTSVSSRGSTNQERLGLKYLADTAEVFDVVTEGQKQAGLLSMRMYAIFACVFTFLVGESATFETPVYPTSSKKRGFFDWGRVGLSKELLCSGKTIVDELIPRVEDQEKLVEAVTVFQQARVAYRTKVELFSRVRHVRDWKLLTKYEAVSVSFLERVSSISSSGGSSVSSGQVDHPVFPAVTGDTNLFGCYTMLAGKSSCPSEGKLSESFRFIRRFLDTVVHKYCVNKTFEWFLHDEDYYSQEDDDLTLFSLLESIDRWNPRQNRSRVPRCDIVHVLETPRDNNSWLFAPSLSFPEKCTVYDSLVDFFLTPEQQAGLSDELLCRYPLYTPHDRKLCLYLLEDSCGSRLEEPWFPVVE
jgi:hypothetical protein